MFLLQRSLSVILCFLALLHLSHCLTCYKCKGSVRWWLLSFWDICYFTILHATVLSPFWKRQSKPPSIQPHFILLKLTFHSQFQLKSPSSSWNWPNPHIPVCLLWATHLRPLGRAHGGVRLKHRVLHACHEAAGVRFSYLFISFSLSYLIMPHIIF